MAKYIGYKTTLKVSTAKTTSSTASAVAVGGIVSIGAGPQSQRAKVPTLILASTVFECQPGLPSDVGEMPLTIAYAQGNAGVNKLLTMHNKGTVGTAFIKFSTAYGLSDDWFNCYVASVGAESRDANGMMQRSISVQPTSTIHWAT